MKNIAYPMHHYHHRGWYNTQLSKIVEMHNKNTEINKYNIVLALGRVPHVIKHATTEG